MTEFFKFSPNLAIFALFYLIDIDMHSLVILAHKQLICVCAQVIGILFEVMVMGI